jgi:hypothetical protein
VADLRSDEVHKVGCLGRDAAPVPGFEEFGLEVGRKQTEHATPFSPVLGGQVAKRLVVTKVVGINTPNPILRGFLVGQHLLGEQGEALTFAGQDTFCRGEPTRGDASGLGPFNDGVTDYQGHWR